MGLIVMLMNFYVFWYHIDPPEKTYAGGRYTTKMPRDYGGESSDSDRNDTSVT